MPLGLLLIIHLVSFLPHFYPAVISLRLTFFLFSFGKHLASSMLTFPSLILKFNAIIKMRSTYYLFLNKKSILVGNKQKYLFIWNSLGFSEDRQHLKLLDCRIFIRFEQILTPLSSLYPLLKIKENSNYVHIRISQHINQFSK